MLLSTALDRMDDFFVKVSRAHYLPACLLLLIFAVAYNGLGIGPIQPYVDTAENPFERAKGYRENYFQASVLLPLIAYYADLESESAFAAFSFIFIASAFLLFVVMAGKRVGVELALLSFALLLAHPVTVILFSWLGMPDGITFLLTVMLFFVRSYSLVVLIGFLGALNHPIIYFAGPMILFLRRLSRESGVTYGHMILALAGLSLGTAALQAFLGLHDIDVASRYHYILARSFTTWLNHNLSLFPLTIFSLHNVVWLALGVCWISSFSRHRNYFVALLLYHLVAYVVTFFSLDTTRIFSLLAWAPALHAILYSLRLSERSGLAGQYLQVRKALLLIAFLGLLMPTYYMWNAKIRAPSFNEFYFSIIPQLRAWLTSLY